MKESIYIKGEQTLLEAILKTDTLIVGAHQDDGELLGFSEWNKGKTLGVIILTDGKGSARPEGYTSLSDDELMELRVREQIEAAKIGDYEFVIQLKLSSAHVKEQRLEIVDWFEKFFLQKQFCKVLTHNPADKHDTHVASLQILLKALKRLPCDKKPLELLGVEVWRALDWLDESDKKVLPVTLSKERIIEVLSIYKSQVASGKRYDLAQIGRMRSNATFLDAYTLDSASFISYGLDLTPLLNDEMLDIATYMKVKLDKFEKNVLGRLSRFN